MRAFFFVLIVALTAAFTPGLTPKPAALTQRRVEPPAITMMPKFLKDLFPDMEKPGARFAERKSAWLRINRQASVRPNQHHTRTTSAPVLRISTAAVIRLQPRHICRRVLVKLKRSKHASARRCFD